MPYTTNPLDRIRIYFEDDGGNGTAVVLYGGILDSVSLVRESEIARSLKELHGEFRLIFADHRGLGRSDKPHDVKEYAMTLRVADAVAILDELGIQRAHFIGTSYGGRLCFGIGEHAPDRILSFIIGGQQPFAMNPDGPIARSVIAGMEAIKKKGIEAFIEALEKGGNMRLRERQRIEYLKNDPAAVAAATDAMLAEGTIAHNFEKWKFPCLIFVGATDADFYEQARRAANEIPNAEFIALAGAGHLGAHMQHDTVIPAVIRTLRAASN